MKKQKEKKEVPQYDDALPERLLGITEEKDVSAAKIHLHTDTIEPSPYILKLTREVLDGVPKDELDDPIAALARSFIIEHEDVADEAPLAVADITEEGLRLSIDDLKEQIKEDESFIAPVTSIIGELRAEKKIDDAVPVDIWSEVHPIDVVGEIIEEFNDEDITAPQGMPQNQAVKFVSGPSLAGKDSFSEADLVSSALPQKEEIALPKVSVFTHRGNGWQRALASFVGLALVAVLPLHALQVLADARQDGGSIEAQSKAAMETFLRGATSLSSEDFGGAQQDFSAAAESFSQAEASLGDLNAGVTTLASVIPQTDRTVDSVHGLVTAGKELSETAAVLSSAANDLSDKKSLQLTDKLSLLGAYMENALPHAQAAERALKKVDTSVVPASYTDSITQLQARTPQLVTSMQEYVQFVNALSTMLGGEQKMRYLAVFQNNTELRPTGGFMGSFAEMDIDQGDVVRMFVPGGGTYDVQGQLQAYVAAPGPLQLLKSRWEFQDANWFPDFPSSAQKLRWFYSQAGGPTSDGVVAVNATFIAELLRILGPVEMPEYGRTFDAENFVFETQKIVELEYDKTENAPKEIIGDLAPILMDRIKTADPQTLLAVVDLVAKGLEEKDIQVNFRDDELQKTAETFGWSGSIKQTNGDYLMVVNTNLGGGKTDGVIDQDVHVDVHIAENGSLENTVTITKTHRGMKSAIFSGNNNVDYIRLYVPQGSQLVSAEGFEVPDDSLFETSDVPLTIDEDLQLHMQNLHKDVATGTDIWEESGKTVFGNWMQTASGETETVTFTYRLPLHLFDNIEKQSLLDFAKGKLGVPELADYTMLVQKQSGVRSRTTTVDVSLPSDMTAVWSSDGEPTGLHFVTNNDTDSFAGWLIEKR